MNIYYVNYQSGYLLSNSPFFSDNAVYILNTKYSSTKCVYVKSDKNIEEFLTQKIIITKTIISLKKLIMKT